MEDNKIKFPRYRKQLRFDENGVYSYGKKIAHLDVSRRTVERSIGESTEHYNYAKHYLAEKYGFRELLYH